MLVGLGQAGWSRLHRLADAGRLPCLGHLIEAGASATLDTLSQHGPTFWTSIATGMPPTAHGVCTGLEVRADGGGVQRAGARSWCAPPVWQALAEAGIATAVVAWPAIAPADRWPGCAIDDQIVEPPIAPRMDWPLPPHCITPVRLRPTLRGLRVHPAELAGAALGGLPARAVAEAATVHAIATHIAEHESWRLLAVYYDLLSQDDGDAAWQFQDAMLARLIDLAGPRSDVIVVSSRGVLIAVGPGFRADSLIHAACGYDVAPTVLAQFGLRADHATGRALGAAECRSLQTIHVSMPRQHPRERPPSPPPDTAAARLVASVEHEAVLQRAASALYAGAYASSAALLEKLVTDKPDDMQARFLLGQCRFFLGEWQACLEIGRYLSEALPSSPWGAMMMGAALALSGDRAAADVNLQAAAALAGDDPVVHIRLGAIALHLGRPLDARAHYEAALATDPNAADARAGLGLACLAQRDAAGAEAHLRASLGLRFHAPILHQQLGIVLAAQRRWAEAADALRTALMQNPNLPGAAEQLREVEARPHRCAGSVARTSSKSASGVAQRAGLQTVFDAKKVVATVRKWLSPPGETAHTQRDYTATTGSQRCSRTHGAP